METQVKRILSAIYLISSLWVMIIALAVAGIFYFLKAILIWLSPSLGFGGAYLFCALLCIVPLLILGHYARSRIRPQRTSLHPSGNTGMGPNGTTDDVAALVQAHPVEAVLLAFTLGFSLEQSADLRALASAASKYAQQH